MSGRAVLQNILKRNFSVSAAARSQHWQQHGIPGSNLPFGIGNKFKLTAYFILFFGTGFNAPFLLVRHQLLKK
ncbi:cytochrome c oxidase subunit 7C, mitochondrial-like [Tubulanus polymorphus]|uniref:cytochrome c oxidase subunit 7C, mitochondrial-like n=1 Tax=Tubulanus polymorphus TaxID=672921 RepID=UPI003DA2041A